MINDQHNILFSYGWNENFQNSFSRFADSGFLPGRILAHSRGNVLTAAPGGELWCSIPGGFAQRMEAQGIRYCTGDWTVIEPYPDGSGARIWEILPRQTVVKRHSAGRDSVSQSLASNIDTVFIVAGLDGDYNPKRLERMTALAWDSGAQPVIILNKADLIEDPVPYLERVKASAPGIPVYSASSLNGEGLENIRRHIGFGKTGVLIGSSGVGKSSILNALAGGRLRKTRAVRDSDSRGRHTTSLRELFLIPESGCIIDSPGIREVGMWTGRDGLDSAFSDVTAEIESLAVHCRFSDCAHQGEPGCEVSEALADGRLSRERFQHYLKLKREMEFAASRENDRIRRDREKKWKDIAKKTRNFKKEKRR